MLKVFVIICITQSLILIIYFQIEGQSCVYQPMDQEQIQQNFSCIICQQIALKAMQGACCGVLLCQDCHNDHNKKSKICPLCRKQNYQVRQALRLRRMISSIKFECKIGCGMKIQKDKLQTHEQECKKRKQKQQEQRQKQKQLKQMDKKYGNQLLEYIESLEKIVRQLKLENCSEILNYQYMHSFQQQQKIDNKQILEVILIELLKRLRQQMQGVGLGDKYWQVLLNMKESNEFLYNVSIVLFRHNSLKQSFQHCLHITQQYQTYNKILPIIFIANSLVQQSIKSKQNTDMCTKMIRKFYDKINANKQLQYYTYCVCNKLLLMIAQANGWQDQQVIHILQLSTLEQKATEMCESLYQELCWLANVNAQFHTQIFATNKKSSRSLEQEQQLLTLNKEISENQNQIKNITELIICILRLFKRQQYFYSLLDTTEKIYKNECYISKKKQLSIIADYNVLEAIYDAILHFNSQKANQVLVEMQLNQIFRAFRLYCYSVCHQKYKRIQNNQESIRQKIEQIVKRIFICCIRNSLRFIDKLQDKEQDKNKWQQLHQQVYDLVSQKLFKVLNQGLVQIGRSNINIRNQLIIRSTLSEIAFKNCPPQKSQYMYQTFKLFYFTHASQIQLNKGKNYKLAQKSVQEYMNQVGSSESISNDPHYLKIKAFLSKQTQFIEDLASKYDDLDAYFDELIDKVVEDLTAQRVLYAFSQQSLSNALQNYLSKQRMQQLFKVLAKQTVKLIKDSNKKKQRNVLKISKQHKSRVQPIQTGRKKNKK